MARILFVNGDPEEYQLFKEALHSISDELTVSYVDCGDKLFHLIQYFTPDLVFLDITLPCNNGIECLKKLRSDNKYDTLPVFIYSTDFNKNYVDECYFSKANYYIVKHYSSENIRKTLEKALKIDMAKDRFPAKEAFVIN